MTHRDRRTLLRSLWAIQEAEDEAFPLMVIRHQRLAPELSLVARFGSIQEMRDELETIIGFHEMQLGATAADRGVRQCAADRFMIAAQGYAAGLTI